MSTNQLRPILTLFVLHTSVHSFPCSQGAVARRGRSRQCRWNKVQDECGSDHPTASLQRNKGSREAGKGAVLGVNYGESEK